MDNMARISVKDIPWPQVGRILGGALIIGVAIAALAMYGRKMAAEPWFWFWVAAIVVTSAVLAFALSAEGRTGSRTRPRATTRSVIIGGGLLLALAAGFFGIEVDPTLAKAGTAQSATQVALGLTLVGVVIGFLFGLPKVNEGGQTVSSVASAPATGGTTSGQQPSNVTTTSVAQSSDSVRLRPNTNLEKVSDWLTTVITGLVLTQLSQVPTYIGLLTSYLSGGLDGAATTTAIAHDPLTVTALGIILHFPLTGFLIGYIATRVLLTPAFDEADRSLFTAEEKGKVDFAPGLLENAVGGFGSNRASPGDRDAAQRIAATDSSKLMTADEKAAYARAHAVLGNYNVAIPWYQAALALDPSNVKLLEQYAAALYADDDCDDAWLMIPPLKKALELSEADDDAYARIGTNLVLAYLYVQPGGFVYALRLANEICNNSKLDKQPSLFFYRACAYGQLYAAIVDGRSFGPNEVPTVEKDEIRRLIVADTRTALNMRPSLVEKFNLVTRGDDKQENDLAIYAKEHPDYLEVLAEYDSASTPADSSAKPVPSLSATSVKVSESVDLSVSEAGYAGSFSVTASAPNVVTITPDKGSRFTITALNTPTSIMLTVTDDHGQSSTIELTVND